MCILLSQALFRPAENILYGVVLVLIYTLVLDKMLLMGATRTACRMHPHIAWDGGSGDDSLPQSAE